MSERCYCLLALLIFLAGCGHKQQTVRLPPPTPAVLGAAEVGIASWYGHPYHGRRTSNGETYDMDQMTAAHLSLPFGTLVRVTNLDNGRDTEVRINDRGPFVKDRIIDLSRAAARQISMIGPGTARVRVEVIATPTMVAANRPSGVVTSSARTIEISQAPEPPLEVSPIPPPEGSSACSDMPYFGVQIGTFGNLENAMRLQGKMLDQHGVAEIVPLRTAKGLLYRLIVGREADSAGAEKLLGSLRQDQIEGFIARVDENSTLNCL
jgi:peptidoglycan lytic transglycosylase